MASTEVVSHSELDTYRQCRFKHQLAYRENWNKTGGESEALSRGSLFHLVLELHYQALQGGWSSQEALARVNSTPGLLYDPETGEADDIQDRVWWMYQGYVSTYLDDADWEIVNVERRLERRLPTGRGGLSRFKMAGTVDLLVKDHSAGGGLWIVDHKTCKNLPKGKDLDLEDQIGVYTYLLRQEGLDIRGAIYNHVRSERLKTREMAPDERFKRTLTVRTDEELETMAIEAYELFQEAYRRRPRGDAPRSPDSERCGWKCNYTEACLVGRKGGDSRAFLSTLGFERQETKPGPTFTKQVPGQPPQTGDGSKR